METPGKPVAVKLLGWLFILVAVFMLLTGGAAIGSVLIAGTSGRNEIEAAFEGAPAMYNVAAGFARYFVAAAALQTVLALLVFFAAVEFMRLRAWARSALEVFSWFSVLFVVSMGVMWVRSWFAMASQMPPSLSAPLSPAAFAFAGALLWGALILVVAACGFFVLRALRSKTVKEVML